ncbi:hypothetical protein, partial [Natrinema pallidum]|uniref:hypothetical protein n=1 Tax=Natrinema pallidum TaxID=69527 RepID=UPI0019D3AB4E
MRVKEVFELPVSNVGFSSMLVMDRTEIKISDSLMPASVTLRDHSRNSTAKRVCFHERVIESVTYEAAGCGKCVQHNRDPARRCFG